ncbi:MAG: very short patch repair endonuclease [Acidobacteriota bacterium]
MIKRTDHVSPETRSAIMRAVKSQGVRSTEKRLRAAMASNGIRGWRMYANELPGKPDFVFPDYRLAVFVDGCFWHGCPKCYRRPHSRQDYWDAKVQYNISRDRRNRTKLRRMGWKIVRIWEHEIAGALSDVCAKLKKLIREYNR